MSIKKAVFAGKVGIGADFPISIQSMTNTPTENAEATGEQILQLAAAGADLVRISVYNEECVSAVRALVDASPVPLVADIHFDHRLAIGAIEQGISKLRINPGNIGGEDKVKMLADCAKRHGIPIRIGVNTGSLPKDILAAYGGITPEAMVEAALRHVKLLEAAHFDDIVISLKASDVRLTVDAYRLADRTFDYPLHVGITEAGTVNSGI
ncbi:MAG: flavodoxin-dependent (E)-4-hydroxy-3-methylbut-2-enyl-diphosphate synthase, partial [Eubacteriales bacterium]